MILCFKSCFVCKNCAHKYKTMPFNHIELRRCRLKLQIILKIKKIYQRRSLMSPLQPFVERKVEEQWYKRIAMLNSNVAMESSS